MSALNNSKASRQQRYAQIPALSLPLVGMHLIEASAGTGKTWTLTGLVVRLIVEKHYNTRQIIATTFTRAAAAEMRGRMRERIAEVWSLLDQASRHEQQVWQQIEASGDVLVMYLLDRLDADQRGHAINRLQQALDSFDDVFIGTLDSFCQKILAEFAFDSGQAEQRKISEQETELRQQIIHDALRAWRSQQDPRLIELMVMTQQLTDVADHEQIVSAVLNFPSAGLTAPTMPQIDFAALDRLLAQVQVLEVSVFEPFLQQDSAAYALLNKQKIFYKEGHLLRGFLEKIQRFGVQVLLALGKDDPEFKLLDNLLTPEKLFKKGGEQHAAALADLTGTQVLQQVEAIRAELKEQLGQVVLCLQHELSQAVRTRLPIALAEAGETSFAEQMRQLADALSDGEEGRVLARQVAYRYPVALVDEFQDTNSDQDRVIARIWRDQLKDAPQQGCVVLVGDPKQAIYGFRGGDVQTYLRASQQIQQAGGGIHRLDQNQRSVALLVDAVDALFARQISMGEGIDYQRVSAGARQHAVLHDDDGANVAPLRWIELQDKQNEFVQIGWQIQRLLQQSSRGALQLDQQPLLPEHIAVLGYSGRELDQVQMVLTQAKIPVWRPSRVSVFASPIAEDLAALMWVMLSPYHEARLRRALSGPLVGWRLSQLAELDAQSGQMAELQGLFAEEGQRWLKQGFLAAWQRLADRLQVWTTLAAHPDGERHLVNLRHLLELLHQYSERMAGPHHVLTWLLRQINDPPQRDSTLERRLPSQSGVQLMTIHGAKGLEFSVVFVAGLDRVRQKHEDVLFYNQAQQRMIGFDKKQADLLADHHERISAEQRRLAYVAITRAKQRLYLCLQPKHQPKTNQYAAPLRHWIEGPEASAWQDWINQQPQLMRSELALSDSPDFVFKAATPSHSLQARPMPQRRIDAWGMTSFSAMIRDLDHSRLAVAIDQPDHDQPDLSAARLDVEQDALWQQDQIELASFDLQSTLPDDVEPTAFDLNDIDPAASIEWPDQWADFDPASTLDQAPAPDWSAMEADESWLVPDDARFDPASDFSIDIDRVEPDDTTTQTDALNVDSIRLDFPRGATSGDCLHKMLEYLDPTKPESWVDTFSRQMQQHLIKEIAPERLIPWFEAIYATPLPDGATLGGLGFRSRVREMDFHLALPQGQIDDQAVIDCMAELDINIASLRQTQRVRYLKGSIDLVYQHGARFYVADYKSNSLPQYDQDSMRQSMNHAGYWLQAAIYLLALHRYLRTRLPNYDIDQHLGGACYLYLRGMSPDQPEQGVVYWRPDSAWLLRFDRVLGGQS